MPKRYYPLLDGVRGLAAIAIMFRHMGGLGMYVFPQSYLGVDLFFILSGAVIANAYEKRLADGMGVRDFFVRRLVRLYPMVVLGLILGALNLLYGDRGDVTHVWLALALALLVLPDTPLLNLGSTNSPGWSLSYELVANGAYAAWLRKLSARALAMISAAFGVILVVAAVYKGHLDTGYSAKSIPFGLARVGFSFFAGVILYRLHQAGQLRVPNSLRGGWGAALCALLLGAAILIVPPVSLRPIAALMSVFVVFPAIVALGLESNLPALATRACDALGKVSYPLYLIHAPLAFLLAHQLVAHGERAHLLAAGMIFAPTMIAAAWLLDRYYDAPTRAAIMSALQLRRRRLAMARGAA